MLQLFWTNYVKHKMGDFLITALLRNNLIIVKQTSSYAPQNFVVVVKITFSNKGISFRPPSCQNVYILNI